MKKILLLVLAACLGFSYTITTFNTSESEIQITFTGAEENTTYGIIVSKNINITNAVMTIKSNATWPSSINDKILVADNITNLAYPPKILVDSNKVVHVFFDTNNGNKNGCSGLFYANSSDNFALNLIAGNCTSWTGINTTNFEYDVDIHNDILHVVLADFGTGGVIDYYYFNSTNWTNYLHYKGAFTSYTYLKDQASLKIDSSGIGHALIGSTVRSGDIGNYNFRLYVNYFRTDDWSNPTRVLSTSTSSNRERSQNILVKTNETIHAFYYEDHDDYILYYFNTSSGPSNIINVSVASYVNQNYFNQMTGAYNGSEVIIFYTDHNNNTYKFTLSELLANAGSSITPTQVSSNTLTPSACANNYGLTHLFLTDPVSTNDLFYGNSSTSYSLINLTQSNGNEFNHWQSCFMPEQEQRPYVIWWNYTGSVFQVLYSPYGHLVSGFNASLNHSTAYNSSLAFYGVQESNISSIVEDSSWQCNASNCTLPLNFSTQTPGKINVTLNITYGTAITGAPAGLSFNLTNGTSAIENIILNDSDVYVWNGSTLVAKIRINFSEQPNYSGWSAEAGVNSTDNRSYVVVAPLTNASKPMNLSQKTVYLKWSNTSLTKVCVINSETNSTQLQAILTENDCTNAGGSVQSPPTTSVNGVTYFELTGLNGSGAVQIQSTGNNPPIINSGNVSPSTGDTLTLFTFSMTASDPDNDTLSAYVVIDGNLHIMGEDQTSDQDTTDGKTFTYTTTLEYGTHSYYFKVNDGQSETNTTTYTGPTVGKTTATTITTTPEPKITYLILLLIGLLAVLKVKR